MLIERLNDEELNYMECMKRFDVNEVDVVSCAQFPNLWTARHVTGYFDEQITCRKKEHA